MKNANFIRTLTLALSLSVLTHGASSQSLYERCSIAVVDGNRSEVEKIAQTIERLSTFSASTLEKAKSCLESQYKHEAIFDYGSSTFSKGAALDSKSQRDVLDRHIQWVEDFHANLAAEKAQAEKERLEREAEVSKRQAEQLKEVEQKEYQAELTRRIYSACIELEERDPVATYTNAICVELFRIGGMPKWKFTP